MTKIWILKQFDIAINYGIKTGYNDAFVIDNDTKEALVAEDPRSADIIKPVLRGRDIQRYQAKWAGLWLIAAFPALGLKINDYPAVKRHLLSFSKARLEQSGRILPNGTKSRKKTSHAWYELQDTCAYHEVFKKEKLIWITLVEKGRFAYDESGIYCLDSSFMMIGKGIKYICALLNTKLSRWYIQQMAPTSGMGTFQWKKVYVETIPIPKVIYRDQVPFIRLVDRILETKTANSSTDMSVTEDKIDQLVYELYGLTEPEISMLDR